MIVLLNITRTTQLQCHQEELWAVQDWELPKEQHLEPKTYRIP